MSILLYGSTGYVGGHIKAYLQTREMPFIAGEARLEDRKALNDEVLLHRPRYIINAAGVTGVPNIDWCETHRQETIRTNFVGMMNLADVAFVNDIKVTMIGSGCIYEFDAEHPPRSGKGFTELDPPNFQRSFYSHLRVQLEKGLESYMSHVLYLRVRFPISDDLHPRSVLAKLIRYDRVVDVPNAFTILDDLIPVAVDMSERGLVGLYNFTNPGSMSHNELLTLYQRIIDPSFTWKNFTVEEQDKILKAARSNNELDCTKLLTLYPDIPPVPAAIEAMLYRMKARGLQGPDAPRIAASRCNDKWHVDL